MISFCGCEIYSFLYVTNRFMFQSHTKCLNCSIKGIDVPKTLVLPAISKYFRRLFNNWDERAFYFGMNYSLLPVKDFLSCCYRTSGDMCLSMKYQTTLRNRCVWHLILLNRVFCCCQDGVEICCGFFEPAWRQAVRWPPLCILGLKTKSF